MGADHPTQHQASEAAPEEHYSQRSSFDAKSTHHLHSNPPNELVEVLSVEILREATLRDLPNELSVVDEVHDEENFVFGGTTGSKIEERVTQLKGRIEMGQSQNSIFVSKCKWGCGYDFSSGGGVSKDGSRVALTHCPVEVKRERRQKRRRSVVEAEEKVDDGGIVGDTTRES
ncbi:hypothetical protein LR48_Vigan09g066600 [Vigna angularis]|uniref:Uncharacterized protein n=1 Tax=Phaseolus angularis TaxID=3914 RepID=A0A0L9VAS5_PHAAN|nr:hypothetical protein LR48_Vigan09g066600 [Vigna angularis]